MPGAFSESLDVSCRATAHTINYCLQQGIPTDSLVDGLAYPLSHLQNPSASISWDHYLTFASNSRRLLSPEQMHDKSFSYARSNAMRSVLMVGGMWWSPKRSFQWAFRGRGNVIGNIFRCITTENVRFEASDGCVEFRLPASYTSPPDEFWNGLAANIAGSADCLGLSPIPMVKWERIPHGAHFRILLPKPSLLRFLSHKIGDWLERGKLRRQQYLNEYWEQRESWLQQEVSQRIRSEQALRESERQLRVLMESAPEAILVYDVDEDCLISANANAEALFEASAADLRRMSIFDLITVGSIRTGELSLQSQLERALSGYSVVFEFESQSQTQKMNRPCEARMVRLPSDTHLVIRVSVTDITARKQAEDELVRARDQAVSAATQIKLREQELSINANRMHEAIRITNTGIFDHDHRSGTIYRSPEFKDIYGWDLGVSEDPFDFLDIVVEEDRPELLAKIAQSHNPQGDGQFFHSYRYQTPAGRTKWAEVRATTFFEVDQGQRIPVRTVGAIVDVTDRIEREAAIQNSQRQLQSIFESSHEEVFSLDTQGKYQAFNRLHFRQMQLAYGQGIQVGYSMLDFVSNENDRSKLAQCFARAIQGEKFVESFQFGASDSGRTLEMSFNPLRAEADRITGVSVFSRDITEQLRAQEALRDSERLQRLALNVSKLGVWRYDRRRRLILLNPRAQEIYGFDREQIGVEEMTARVHPDDVAMVLERSRGLAKDETQVLEHRLLLPSDDIRWVSVCIARLHEDTVGSSTELVGTVMDVTEREHTAFLLAGSLHEKEAMLKEIHHRVKNNLQVISSLLNLQAMESESEEVRSFSTESQRRIRAMALVHETLYQSDSLAKIQMARYVEQLCHALTHSYSPDQFCLTVQVADLQLGLEYALPIGLMLGELVTNALKHAFQADTKERQIAVKLDRYANEKLVLSVSDNGRGLSAGFSLPNEKSFGLRLVQLLAQQLRANLVASNSNGAKFIIEIPYVF